jgi:hypothetical protein
MRCSLAVLVACLPLCGCLGLGPIRLRADQIGFSRALLDSEKQATLLNAVRLRYADTPVFLDTTQVISGYQLQRSLTGGFEVFPNAALSTFLNGGGAVQLQETPTFTFQPETGEEFTTSIIRPLSPTTLLALALGGLPVDLLFRLGVQSINNLNNSLALASNESEGSPDFFLLLHDLRALQIARLIDLRLEVAQGAATKRNSNNGGGAPSEHIHLSFAPTQDRELTSILNETKRLLGLSQDVREVELVYGLHAPAPGQVAILTRSMLGVLGEVAISIEVPSDDVMRGRTVPTIAAIGIERGPVVTVHSGRVAPQDSFAAAEYRGTWFWIANDDFASKLAFSVIQILFATAKVGHAPGAIITIPAG